MENLLDILGKIGFDWQVALANLVNFLIILFILKKFAFKPIGKLINERRAKIDKGLEDARKAETELVMASVKREEIMGDAKKEAGLLMARAAETRNQIVDDAKEKAAAEAAMVLASAEKEIEAKRGKLEREVKEKSVGLILRSAEKLIKENMTTEKNEKIIRSAIGA